MNKGQYFLRKHSPTILTIIGGVGVIGTAVLAVKATPKALRLIETAKEIKGEELTRVEIVKVAWKPYIPAAITCVSTLACIFGANMLNTRNQASLMSAYALLDNAYREYRDKTKELYGDNADKDVRNEVIKCLFDGYESDPEDGKMLFMDFNSLQIFESTMEEVMAAENAFLEVFHERGYASLNEYLDFMGVPRTDFGYQLGWFDVESNDPYNVKEFCIDYEKIMVDSIGRECWIITTNIPPVADYIF